jgi:hypothetical protein
VTQRQHVEPVNDVRGHDCSDGALCPCMPLTKRLGMECDGARDEIELVIHMSYDGREIGEVCRKALDSLALALTEYHHQWSSEDRFDYEHAIHLLNMHYPKKETAT